MSYIAWFQRNRKCFLPDKKPDCTISHMFDRPCLSWHSCWENWLLTEVETTAAPAAAAPCGDIIVKHYYIIYILYIFILYYSLFPVFSLFWLSEPVKLIAWNDSSQK